MQTDKITSGKDLRKKSSRKSHSFYEANPNRPSVAEMISESDNGRLPELVPIRHQRMSASPFAFYRATASIMARDLSYLPNTGLQVQAIGDCHLMNFGGFATPERSLIFDVNDFDETHPAPFEWDLKRLAASFVLAARHAGMSDASAKDTAYTLAQSYRENMATLSSMSMLDLWYMKFDLQSIRREAKNERARRVLDATMEKAQKSTHQQTLYKLTSNVLGTFEITEQKPLVYHLFDVKKDKAMIMQFMDEYRGTLQNDRRWLFDQYQVVDVALKVVGVGSVGTRCFVVLLINEKQEPLFIQVKEAGPSVLEAYTQKSIFNHNGQRVVEGQRLVQAASDIFLGWSTGPLGGRHYYLRQLKDKKIGLDVENFDKGLLSSYAKLCGRMLARAHAKAGSAALLSGYMGSSDALDESISEFALKYADQTEKDYDDFMKAIKSGKLEVKKDEAITELSLAANQ